MNEHFRFSPTAGTFRVTKWMRRLAATSLDWSRRSVALGLVGLMIPMGLAQVSAFAQDAPPPPPDQQQAPPPDQQGPPPDDQAPPQQWNALSPDQLNQLVAPIALYPDSLVAQVVAAATYPTQIVEADRFVQSQAGAPPESIAQAVNQQGWDPSVKALAAFPSVLANMDKNLDWTTQLGNAYYNQPQDVMNAVQTMRQQAYSAGHLRSNAQLAVTYAPNDIVIAPANPAVVYVPYYDPWVMWGFHPYYAWYAPPPPYGFRAGFGFGFGVGIAVGVWGGFGWGWGHWGMGWGPHPYVAYGHGVWVSHSVTVVNHGYYGRFDRAPGARAYNVQAAHTAYARGYAAGAHNGYNAGARNGYNAGARNGYNAGARAGNNNGYNRGAAAGHPAAGNNYHGAPGNNSRPAGGNNYHPSTGGSNYHPAPQGRQAPQGRPAPQSHSTPHAAAPHSESHPSAPRGGGDRGGHPHGR